MLEVEGMTKDTAPDYIYWNLYLANAKNKDVLAKIVHVYHMDYGVLVYVIVQRSETNQMKGRNGTPIQLRTS